MLESSLGKYSPPRCDLKFPFKVDDKWTSKSTILIKADLEFDASQAYRVVGTETLKTKAGEYEAVCVEYEGTGVNMTSRSKVWYSKAIGIVRSESTVQVVSSKKPDTITMTVKVVAIPKAVPK